MKIHMCWTFGSKFSEFFRVLAKVDEKWCLVWKLKRGEFNFIGNSSSLNTETARLLQSVNIQRPTVMCVFDHRGVKFVFSITFICFSLAFVDYLSVISLSSKSNISFTQTFFHVLKFGHIVGSTESILKIHEQMNSIFFCQKNFIL